MCRRTRLDVLVSTALGAAAALALCSAPLGARAASYIQFLNDESMINNEVVYSVYGTHVGGKGYLMGTGQFDDYWQPAFLTVRTVYSGGTYGQAVGPGWQTINYSHPAVANSRVRCSWHSNSNPPLSIPVDCWRYRA